MSLRVYTSRARAPIRGAYCETEESTHLSQRATSLLYSDMADSWNLVLGQVVSMHCAQTSDGVVSYERSEKPQVAWAVCHDKDLLVASRPGPLHNASFSLFTPSILMTPHSVEHDARLTSASRLSSDSSSARILASSRFRFVKDEADRRWIEYGSWENRAGPAETLTSEMGAKSY